MTATRHASQRLKGLVLFCLAVAAMLLFFSVISPRIIAGSPALRQYGLNQELLGIHSGLMYYTDLKTMQETQDAVRYALEQNARRP